MQACSFVFPQKRCKPCGALSAHLLKSSFSTQEVQAFAAVEGHPNIVTFYDSWAETDQSSNADHFFIRLELCGVSLKEVVASNKGYCWKETELLDLMRQVGVNLCACML